MNYSGFNLALNRRQFAIAKKLRIYLRSDMSNIKKGMRLYFISRLYQGLCVGFTTLWLYSKWLSIANQESPPVKIKDEKWFWTVVDLILEWDGERVLSDEEIVDVDFFIKMLERFQNIGKYNHKINQGELDKIIKDMNQGSSIKKEYAIGSLFTLEEFRRLLQVKNFIRERRLILITSHNHATGLFKLDNYYYYYDASSFVGVCVTESLDYLAANIFAANGFEEQTPSPIGIRIFFLDQETEPYLSPKDLLKQVDIKSVPKSGYADGYSSLIMAAEVGSLESVQFFLDLNKVDPNKVNDDGNTAFMLASSYGYVDIVKAFLKDKRTTVDVVNKEGQTALMLASHFCHSEVVKAILEDEYQRVDVNKFGICSKNLNALMRAIYDECSDVVKVLLEDKYHRVDVDAVDSSGLTALRYAKFTNNPDLINMLLSYKDNPV